MPYFAVYAPDYTDEDAINRRFAVRAEHFEKALANPAIKAGGAILSPNEALDTPDAPQKIIGSVDIIEAESYAAARAIVESDVYWKGNVWDKEKTVIHPWVPPKPILGYQPSE